MRDKSSKPDAGRQMSLQIVQYLDKTLTFRESEQSLHPAVVWHSYSTPTEPLFFTFLHQAKLPLFWAQPKYNIWQAEFR